MHPHARSIEQGWSPAAVGQIEFSLERIFLSTTKRCERNPIKIRLRNEFQFYDSHGARIPRSNLLGPISFFNSRLFYKIDAIFRIEKALRVVFWNGKV